MGSRIHSVMHMQWPDMCRSKHYRGRWVALDNVRYDPSTSHPIEADVVDVDDDLADLCARIREANRSSCSIVFCDDDGAPGKVHRPSQIPPRAAQH